ncbi:unnamed protein product [Leuciscus chuanchicus]
MAWAPYGRDGVEGVSSSSQRVFGSDRLEQYSAVKESSCCPPPPALCYARWRPLDLRTEKGKTACRLKEDLPPRRAARAIETRIFSSAVMSSNSACLVIVKKVLALSYGMLRQSFSKGSLIGNEPHPPLTIVL